MVASLRGLAERLGAERPEIMEIRLFGSLARGSRNPRADADLLIVLDASDIPFRDRLPVYKPRGSPVPMDLTVCTREELQREVTAGNRFIRRILDESVVLYGRASAEPPTRT
ncbi:MAG: nucleotidyltransferase domain-containing protein [Candidatus Rokuibacteriota bacterium]